MFFGAFLRLYGIPSQPPLSDEVQVAFSALHYMENGQFGPTMWYHPNLRNIIVYWSGKAFGYGPYALRSISLLAGILSIPVAGLLLYSLTRNRTASVSTALLLTVDQVHITFSRQAIQEAWTMFFFLLGTLLAVLYFKGVSAVPFLLGKGGDKEDKPQREGSAALMLIFSGLSFGLGIASKFHSLFPLFVCLGAGMFFSWKERSPSKGILIICCLVLIPSLVYFLTYIPWFGRGYGITDWIEMQRVVLTKMMTHTGNPMDQIIDTKAWQWFLRPMGYANFVHFDGKPFVTIAFSNPFVWTLVLPSTGFIMASLLRRESIISYERNGTWFILILFIAAYLPLALSPRPLWLLSSLATLPFALMVVSLAITRLSQAAVWGKKALAVYIAIVVLSSLALYPMAVGKGKHYGYLNSIAERFRPPFERTQ